MTRHPSNGDFACIQCRGYVASTYLLSGVNNRNHCPYCLWSRHLDLFAPGDRLSACKEAMQPIGMTTKPNRNRYAEGGGELMLVHLCVACGQVSINRIAADDDAVSLQEVHLKSAYLPAEMQANLLAAGIHLLAPGEATVVKRQLLGVETLSG